MWYHEADKGSSYLNGQMKILTSTVPWSKEGKVRSRMNLQFSLSKTLRLVGLEILEEEAIGFSGESSMDEEEEEREDSCTKGLRSLEILGFAEFEEIEDMMNIKRLVQAKASPLEGQ